MIHHESSVLISLLTYPHKGSKLYIELIKKHIKNLQAKRRKNFENKPISEEDFSDHLEPILYHMFGKFDIAYVMLIDNLALSNKSFYPLTDIEIEPLVLETFKTQLISGITTCKKEFDLKLQFKEFSNLPFIGITNIKLNNGLLLGCGYTFINYVFNQINYTLLDHPNINCIILESFGTYELTLIVSSKNISHIAEFIEAIRDLSIDTTSKSSNEIRNKYFYSLIEKSKSNFINYHLFSDTQTHYGIKINQDYSLAKHEELSNVKIAFEWLVKPGHFQELSRLLRTKLNLDSLINKDEVFFLPGKYDYSFGLNNNNNFEFSSTLFKYLRDNDNFNDENVKNHVRGIETKIKFKRNINSKDEKAPSVYSGTGSISFLEEQSYSRDDIFKLKENLKTLKISKTLRQRIIKLFISYNNLLQNPIIYNLAIDFRFFVHNLEKQIRVLSNNVIQFYENQTDHNQANVYDQPKSVLDVEKVLSTYLTIFEEGFYLRYVNNYTLEESNDFHIAYNIQLQQIITAFDNYYKLIGYKILKDKTSKSAIIDPLKNKVILARVNGIETLTNEIGVSFSLHNLYEPSSLFALFSKEIFSVLIRSELYTPCIKEIKQDTYLFWQNFQIKNPNSEILIYSEVITGFENSYILIDILRLYYFFNKDYELFYYYQWYLLMQLSLLYDVNGCFNRSILYKELYRILVVAALFDYLNQDKSTQYFIHCNISAPTAEIAEQWQYFTTICSPFVEELVNTSLGDTFKKIFANEDLNLAQYKDSFIEPIKINTLLSEIEKIIKDKVPVSENIFIKEFSARIENMYSDKFNLFQKDLLFEWLAEENIRITGYAIMKHIANYNSNTIVTLKRSWKDGAISNIPAANTYFLIDPQGGVFFHDHPKMLVFNKLRNSIFAYLKHVSMVYKKYLFMITTKESL